MIDVESPLEAIGRYYSDKVVAKDARQVSAAGAQSAGESGSRDGSWLDRLDCVRHPVILVFCFVVPVFDTWVHLGRTMWGRRWICCCPVGMRWMWWWLRERVKAWADARQLQAPHMLGGEQPSFLDDTGG